ncbi:MCE family protein [Tomitella biformata]|uniref:MCE family protein n=1 Tax=Tomitella biformata TaxID=630403 RepID=UPI0004BB0A93|nr:MCE family protein [Tomitella biformata]
MKVNYKLYALGMVVILVGLATVALTSFAGGFDSTKRVTVRADRAGLVMEPNGKVKMLGVQIGTVAGITQDADGASLELDIDSSKMSLIPENVDVDIRSATVFGAKYVNLVEPASPSADHLASGAVIDSEHVTVEFNTLFGNLQSVLQTVQPEKINATLGSISTALNGQGKNLGETLHKADDYLAEMNPTLPALEHDLKQAAIVTDTYADLTPDLMQMLANTTAVGETVVSEAENLHQSLLGTTGLANTGDALLGEAGEDFVTAMDYLQPTFSTVNDYSSVLTCFIVGVSLVKDAGQAAFGGDQPGLSLSSTFLAGAPAYSYPENLPKVNAKNAPSCYGLPWVDETKNAPYVVTDSGVNPSIVEHQQTNPQSLWGFLIGPPPPGWTW